MKGGWVAEAAELWKQKTGAKPNIKRLAGELGILQREGYSREKILSHWKVYLQKTGVEFLSPTAFRTRFNAYRPDMYRRAKVDKELDRQHQKKLEHSKRQPRSNDLEKLGEFVEKYNAWKERQNGQDS